MKTKYEIIRKFSCHGKNMVVVGMDGATCTMEQCEFNEILKSEMRNNRNFQPPNQEV